jgi:hypothetical protein
MNRFVLFIAVVLCVLPGCRRELAADADPAVADKALQTALGAWKSGKSPKDLEKENPAIVMNEDDWRVGKRLLEFKMEKSALSGRQVRCRVQIKLQDKDNKTVEQTVTYIIDTNPRIVIVRDSFAT